MKRRITRVNYRWLTLKDCILASSISFNVTDNRTPSNAPPSRQPTTCIKSLSAERGRLGPLRHYLDSPKLVEVVIEGKRHIDIELFHDDFACAVGEAPTLIVELLKCLPRKRQLSGGNLVYFRKIMVKEPRA